MNEYLLLTLACGAGTYLWRGLGVAVSARIRPDSELFAWVGCVAFAMIAGLISRILFFPRVSWSKPSFGNGLLVRRLRLFYLLTRRNLFAGVIASGATMYLILALTR